MNKFQTKPENGLPPEAVPLTPLFKTYDPLPFDEAEILRYAGVPLSVLKGEGAMAGDAGGDMHPLVSWGIAASAPLIRPMVSYCYAPLSRDSDGFPVLPFLQHSRDLKAALSGCCGAVLFAATIGAGIDRLIRRYERLTPAKALILQAIGAQQAEALCDRFNVEITGSLRASGFDTRPRYSPGYGDLPLSVQPDMLSLTDAGRRMGITLNASYLMSPSKSVTAIIGFG